jgi:hypothetical protein
MDDTTEASRDRWKRRAQVLRQGYRDMEIEATALYVQKLYVTAALESAAESLCTAVCPTVWKSDGLRPHAEACRRAREALGVHG